MSFNFGSSKSTTNSKAQSDPWDVTIPYLEGILKAAGSQGGVGLTPDQVGAFKQLKTNASQGNPWEGKISGLADMAFATPDRTGMVGDAYTKLQGQLGDIASGKYLDPMSNPEMQRMLTMVGDDISQRINAQFAGAGRDLSGANQGTVARGVAQGQTGLLFDQYNKERANQASAAQTLYGASGDTAKTQSALDVARQGQMAQGVGFGEQAIEAGNYFPNAILNLDQQIKGLPIEDLKGLASLLFPAAQLGEQTQGTSTTKSSGFGLGGKLLSDKDAKEDAEVIGEMADGTPIYRYRYKGDPTIRVGPMAQDIEQDNPGAVDDNGPGGLKTVDMDAATRRAAAIVKARRNPSSENRVPAKKKGGGY